MSIRAAAIDPLGDPSRSRIASALRYVVALLAVGAAVALLEVRVLDLDHGTHLLVILSLVTGMALVLGPGPAATGFLVGGGLAVAASIITVQGVLGTPHVYVQSSTYVIAGTALIALVALNVRVRRGSVRPLARPFPDLAPGPGPLESLTARELEVLRLAATGIPVDAIAERLFVSPNTVKTHLTHVYAKLGVHGRSDAVRAALHCGCLTPTDICPHRSGIAAAESPIQVRREHRNG